MYVQSFKQLTVWQKAMQLVEAIYIASAKLPNAEQFGLISQMRRAAISIPSNITEGKKRKTRKDFVQFLHISDGSAAELETQILLAKKLYTAINFVKCEELLDEVQKMLTVMIQKLEPLKANSSKL